MCITDKVMFLQCQYSVYNWQHGNCYSSVSILCMTDNMMLLKCQYSVYYQQSDVIPVSVFCV